MVLQLRRHWLTRRCHVWWGLCPASFLGPPIGNVAHAIVKVSRNAGRPHSHGVMQTRQRSETAHSYGTLRCAQRTTDEQARDLPPRSAAADAVPPQHDVVTAGASAQRRQAGGPQPQHLGPGATKFSLLGVYPSSVCFCAKSRFQWIWLLSCVLRRGTHRFHIALRSRRPFPTWFAESKRPAPAISRGYSPSEGTTPTIHSVIMPSVPGQEAFPSAFTAVCR